MKKLWTQDDLECLKAMREAGWEVKDISKEMGYSVSTLEAYIRSNNLFKNKKWTIEDDKKLIDLTEEGLNSRECSEELGRSIDSIKTRRVHLGITVKHVYCKEWTQEECAYLMESNEDANTCANTLGRKRYEIYRQRKILGITRSYISSGDYVGKVESVNNTYSQKADKPTKVYLIDFGDFYKVGTTQQTINQRFGGRYPKYSVVFFIETTLEEARGIEKQWLENVKHLKYVPDCFPVEGRGFTECFKCD